MKKFAIAVLVLVLALTLAGCGKSRSDKIWEKITGCCKSRSPPRKDSNTSARYTADLLRQSRKELFDTCLSPP